MGISLKALIWEFKNPKIRFKACGLFVPTTLFLSSVFWILYFAHEGCIIRIAAQRATDGLSHKYEEICSQILKHLRAQCRGNLPSKHKMTDTFHFSLMQLLSAKCVHHFHTSILPCPTFINRHVSPRKRS